MVSVQSAEETPALLSGGQTGPASPEITKKKANAQLPMNICRICCAQKNWLIMLIRPLRFAFQIFMKYLPYVADIVKQLILRLIYVGIFILNANKFFFFVTVLVINKRRRKERKITMLLSLLRSNGKKK